MLDFHTFLSLIKKLFSEGLIGYLGKSNQIWLLGKHKLFPGLSIYNDLIGVSLCVWLHVCDLMEIPCGITGNLRRKISRFIACSFRAESWPPSKSLRRLQVGGSLVFECILPITYRLQIS